MKDNLQDLLSTLDSELEKDLERKLRAELETRDKAWLVENLVQQILHERYLHATPHRQLSRQAQQVETPAERRQRLERIRKLGLDEAMLRQTVERYRALDRDVLVSEGYLVDPPHKGKEALGPEHRNAEGEALLQGANDLFYALLFCDERQGVQLNRVRRDFVTVTLPSTKAGNLERFMLAVTEMQVSGTWLDPEGVSDDIGASNKVLQVEFGDSADGFICEALLATLTLINNLEVNEEILYARIEQLERSTLV